MSHDKEKVKSVKDAIEDLNRRILALPADLEVEIRIFQHQIIGRASKDTIEVKVRKNL